MDAIELQRVESRSSRVIVLDSNPAVVESVSHVLQHDMPDLTIERCTTAGRAQLLFKTSPKTSSYHAIICSPSLTIVDGNSLLTQSYRAQPPVPFLLTIRTDERELEFAQHWLDLGVYDFILTPLDSQQAIQSIQQALILSKRRATIVRQEKILADLRERRACYRATAPDSPLRERLDTLLKGSILRIQEATGYLERHVTQLERTLEALQRSCDQNELHARCRALDRLRANLAR